MTHELNFMTESCGVCGYTFKPGDIVHELEIGGDEETVCDMCYHNVLKRG